MDLLARTCNYDRMSLQRIIARGFVIFGGVFWVVAALGASTYLSDTPLHSPWAALIPLVIAIVAFLIGWFYERLAAIVLFAGTAVVIVWGLIAGWEAGVWLTMILFFIAEMFVAGLLFWLAARTQSVCEERQAQMKQAAS